MLQTIFSGPDDLIIIVVALVVIFGGTQLPKLARNAGEAVREFRKTKDEVKSPAPPAGAAVPPAASSPAAAPVGHAAELAPPAPVAEEQVTLKRAELDALLAAREASAREEAAKRQQ